MNNNRFSALMLTEVEGKTEANIEQLAEGDLPEGDVLLETDYSSLNYKDALAVTGKGKIVRNWPMVPGIDIAGTVLASDSGDYQPGDKVVLTGWSVGERYWGGYSQRQRVRSQWLVPMPEGLDARRAMTIGTAGFTAMLCVMALEEAGITPDRGTVLVTGASGGVGSVSLAILNRLGYKVAALTHNPDKHDFVRDLGASEIVDGPEWSEKARPLEKQRWAGAIDAVGSGVLARVLAEVDYEGAVAACGLAGGADLPTTVMPFILRGVRLQGIDSVMCPLERRKQAWQRLVTDLPMAALDKIGSREVSLAEVPQAAADLLAGKITGRVLVNLKAG